MQNYCFNKIVAAGLLVIYLFNLSGYPLVLRLLISQSSRQTNTIIQNGRYSQDELVHIKIPVLLPYSTNWDEYETYDGEVEYEGVYYRFVKRKVANDTLHLLCLPDFKLTRLHTAKDQYAVQANDCHAPSSEKSTQVTGKNTPSSEYEQPRIVCWLIPPSLGVLSRCDAPPSFLKNIESDCLIQPPDDMV